MNYKLMEAIELRLGAMKYLNEVRRIDQTVENISFERNSKEIIDIKALSEWKNLSFEYNQKIKKVPETNRAKFIADMQEKMKSIIVNSLVEITTEIILCKPEVSCIYFGHDGLKLEDKNKSRVSHNGRYTIPNYLKEALEPLITKEVMTSALQEFNAQNCLRPVYAKYISVSFIKCEIKLEF